MKKLNLGESGIMVSPIIFGAWAILSGLLQLGTAVRRWKRFGAQWAMVLSGGQSALAGGFFIFGVCAHIAHMGEGEAHDLARIGGIGEDFLVPGHRGVEAKLGDGAAGRARAFAVKHCSV